MSSIAASLRNWDVYLATNQVANRTAFSAMRTGVLMSIARNNHERIEKLIGFAGFLTIAVMIPTMLELLISRRVGRKMGLRSDGKGNPLLLPFEWIKKHGGFKKAQQDIKAKLDQNIWNKTNELEQLEKYGLNSWKDLTESDLMKRVRRWKATIMLADFAIMASSNQIVYLFRNWFTEKRSKRKGFSGEFNYASEKYTESESKEYEDHKKKRRLISLISGYGSSLLLPAVLLKGLNSKANKGFFNWFKKRALPKLNYTNAIFMSRWVMLYQLFFSYDIPKLMAARDRHELRENLVDLAYFNGLYFLGDELIASMAAIPMQKKLGDKLEGVSLTKKFKMFGREWHASRSLTDIYERVKENRNHPAFKAGRKTFLWGLFGSSAVMAGVTLTNYSITRHKVMKDMKIMNQKILAHMSQLAGKQSLMAPSTRRHFMLGQN